MIYPAQNPKIDHARVMALKQHICLSNYDKELKSIEKEYQECLKFAKLEKEHTIKSHNFKIGGDLKYKYGFNREEMDEKFKKAYKEVDDLYQKRIKDCEKVYN